MNHDRVSVFRAEGSKEHILICPGGCYEFISEREGVFVARAFQQAGFQAYVLNYSTRSTTQGPVKDCARLELKEAVEQLVAEFPAERILLCGFSAGGHLVLSYLKHELATAGQVPVDKIILGYPVIEASRRGHLQSGIALHGDDVPDAEIWPDHVLRQMVPTFIWHTGEDETTPSSGSIDFVRQLTAQKVAVEFHLFPYGIHGLSLATAEVEQLDKGRFQDVHVAQWFPLCIEFLRL